MLTDQSMNQTARKLERLTRTLREHLFFPVGRAEDLGVYQTTVPMHTIPDDSLYAPAKDCWGGEGVYDGSACVTPYRKR